MRYCFWFIALRYILHK